MSKNINDISEIEQKAGVSEVVYYDHFHKVRTEKINKDAESFLSRFSGALDAMPLSTEHRGQIQNMVKDFVAEFAGAHRVNFDKTLLEIRERHMSSAGADSLGQAINTLTVAGNAVNQARQGIEALKYQLQARNEKPKAA